MNQITRKIPSIRALAALERVARLGNVTRAAEELHTSQAAVSRHLRQLEQELGVALVAKSGRGIALTSQGETYARDISDALAQLRRAGERVSENRLTLTIACTHEVSHLLLMPHYAALREVLGRNTHVRILTCEYAAIPAMIDVGADIVFEYLPRRPRQPSAPILAEEIVPAAAPVVATSEAKKLRRSPAYWKNIPRLTLTKDNSGWATWEDWFEAQAAEVPNAPLQMFDNYVYALEAATRGEGLVIAWRGFVDRYLESGQLVTIGDEWLRCGPRLYAVVTRNGINKPLSKKCLRFLTSSAAHS